MLPKAHAGQFKNEDELNASIQKREQLVKQGSLVQKLIYSSNEDIDYINCDLGAGSD